MTGTPPAPGTRRPVPAPPPWRRNDPVSLWAFVLACTGFGGPVAVVLGILALRRTADDSSADALGVRRSAITGVVLGLVGTVTHYYPSKGGWTGHSSA